eukprot:1060887-Rhodomonas_salina.1
MGCILQCIKAWPLRRSTWHHPRAYSGVPQPASWRTRQHTQEAPPFPGRGCPGPCGPVDAAEGRWSGGPLDELQGRWSG